MRLYFGFKTNIPDTVKELSTVQVEAITFKHKNGEEITIRLYGEADYGVEDGEYDARWKGLEFELDEETELIKSSDIIGLEEGCDIYIPDDDEYEDIEVPESVYDDIIKALKDSVPCGIEYYYEEPEYWNVPDDEDFTPTCEDMDISLCYGDEEYEWKCDKL